MGSLCKFIVIHMGGIAVEKIMNWRDFLLGRSVTIHYKIYHAEFMVFGPLWSITSPYYLMLNIWTGVVFRQVRRLIEN